MSTIKFVRVTMPNGKQYDISSYVIARICAKRAAFQAAALDASQSYDQIYRTRFDHIIDNNTEILYGANSLAWKDVADTAIPVEITQVIDYEQGWANGAKSIVEHDLEASE